MISERVAAWQARAERLQERALERPRLRCAYDTYQRYYAVGMHHVAGSVTYFGILTLLPVLALLLLLASNIVVDHPGLRTESNQAVAQALGLDVDLGGKFFSAQARASIQAILAVLGVTGFVYAGRYWVDAYRRALRTIWNDPVPLTLSNFVWRYMRDMLVFTLVALSVIVLLALAILATNAPYRLMAADGHGLSTWAVVTARIAAGIATAAWAAFISAALYHRLGRAPRTAAVRHASIMAGVALAGLVLVGLYLLKYAFTNTVYGIVVAMIGLMLWVSGTVRMTLSLGVWAAMTDGTGTGSGTAAPEPPDVVTTTRS
ncbi:YihY/virulence factor BrkB family protein [Actinomadura barringtoniae]|uniref:YihY/virulence factor BrkB family protein n=1 Tax=Actinomadura barringtoniae TaxID=1427535 RepID=A0A939PIZ6_9ACTN|nr:YhjD/YihY/BrkB family envelope integrity protein [Actinomadura barringtoniae]MBO2453043.1 YihY/virulence factor BrkB family protein [Actinomadura barringtoniae]